MAKASIRMSYDKDKDVMYVFKGRPRETINVPLEEDTTIRFNPQRPEALGFIITNFSEAYPDLEKNYIPARRWFVRMFFKLRMKDIDSLLAEMLSSKERPLEKYLASEKINSKYKVYA